MGNEEKCYETGSYDISLADASALTARYRTNSPATAIKGIFYGKQALMDLLNQDGCIGTRIYYGLDANMVQKLVLVGVTASMDDMCSGKLMQHGTPCPSMCGTSNPLNS